MFGIGLLSGIILGLIAYFGFFKHKPKNQRIRYSVWLFLIGIFLPILVIFIAVALNGM